MGILVLKYNKSFDYFLFIDWLGNFLNQNLLNDKKSSSEHPLMESSQLKQFFFLFVENVILFGSRF